MEVAVLVSLVSGAVSSCFVGLSIARWRFESSLEKKVLDEAKRLAEALEASSKAHNSLMQAVGDLRNIVERHELKLTSASLDPFAKMKGR